MNDKDTDIEISEDAKFYFEGFRYPSDLFGAEPLTEDEIYKAKEQLCGDAVRTFETGATRDTADGKFDFEGFLSPSVLERYAEYMHSHRTQTDGTLRDSDNWQKGIPKLVYLKSGWRHFFDWWKEHRGISTKDGIEVALCALLFNVMGYLHEHLKDKSGIHKE